MGKLVFSWDDRKAGSSERKHGVSFDDAMTVFTNDFALFDDDPTVRIQKTASFCSA